jgi:hypothetical protein
VFAVVTAGTTLAVAVEIVLGWLGFLWCGLRCTGGFFFLTVLVVLVVVVSWAAVVVLLELLEVELPALPQPATTPSAPARTHTRAAFRGPNFLIASMTQPG